jgi:hypothetical protein
MTSDIAIRVDHCILSGVEGLSKLYHLGRAQSRAGDSLRSQRHDTTSTGLRGAPLWGSASLRDALSSVFSRQSSVGSRQSRLTTDNSELKTDNCELKTDNSLSSHASPSRCRTAPTSGRAETPC